MAGMEETAVAEMVKWGKWQWYGSREGNGGNGGSTEVTAVREVTVVTEEMAATKFNHALISLLSWLQAYKTGQNSNYHGLIHS
uniref:hypothetical protein n=1 Tax=Enterobacter agglomerans TaxID=549 RepID=UPI0013BEDCDB|nr:hypothetical protein [Pantoea agglomerans]NEG48947.1 hypothetical protein [Pantoea agglomerans]